MQKPNLPSAEELRKEGNAVDFVTPEIVSNSVGCNHKFEYNTTREAQCTRCGLIVFLEAGDTIKKGKLDKAH